MGEVEQKINLENAQYEELMLELQLNKTKHGQSNGTGNGYPPGMDGHGHGGLGGLDRITAHTSASHLGLNGYNGHGAHGGRSCLNFVSNLNYTLEFVLNNF